MRDTVDKQDLPGAQYFIDRAQQKGRVFPLPVDLVPGEDIRGAAMRAAARNLFPDTKAVIELARSGSFRSIAAVHGSASAADLDRLVDVLGIRKDADHVQQLLVGERTTSRDWIRFSGIDIRRGHLVRQRRVAPGSLKIAERQKAIWALRPFDFDLATGERLLDRCPECKKELGWGRSFGVSFCDKCPSAENPLKGGVDLRQFTQPSVDISDDRAVHLISTLIDPEARLRHTLHPDLAVLDRGELFQLAIKIARPSGNQGWLRSLDVQEIERAGQALLSWPEAFDELAERELPEGNSSEPGGRGLDRLQDDNKLSRRVRLLVKQRRDVRMRKAALRQGAGASELAGRPIVLPRARGYRAELKRLASTPGVTAVEAAVGVLRSSAQHRRLAADLGIPLPWLLDLYAAGILPELAEVLDAVLPTAVDPPGTPLLATIRNIASTKSPAHTLTIHSAFFALSNWNGTTCAELFRAFCDGTLEVAVDRRSSLAIAQRLRCEDFEALRFAPLMRGGVSASDLVSLTQCEAALSLGKPCSVVRALVRNDFLGSNMTSQDVAVLRKNWMFLNEVLDLARLKRRQDLGNIRYWLINSGIARETAGHVCLWSRIGVREFLARDGLPANHEFG